MTDPQSQPNSVCESTEDADSVLISRQVFDSRLRYVAFDSWDSFKAAVAENRPRALQHHGDGGTVVRLDPLRVFGWVATILINICVWGMVGFVATWSQLLALACLLIYGAILWWVTTRQLSPELAGVLWPILPCIAAAAGLLVCVLLHVQALNDRVATCFHLGFVILPHTMLAAYFLRGLPQDPDRATLVLNLFLGTWATVLAVFLLVIGQESVQTDAGYDIWFYFLFGSLFFLGFVAVLIAGRLFVVPSVFGSVEAVSWTLNVGVVAVFIAVQALLSVPIAQDLWRWLIFALIATWIGLTGAIFDRSLPILVSAVGCLMVAIYFSNKITTVVGDMGAPSSLLTIMGLATFGALGILIVVVAQRLKQSEQFSAFVTRVQDAHARAYYQMLPDDLRTPIERP